MAISLHHRAAPARAPGLEAAELPPDWLPVGDGMKDLYTIPIAAFVAALFGALFACRPCA